MFDDLEDFDMFFHLGCFYIHHKNSAFVTVEYEIQK